MNVAVDAGHGGDDPGGRSLGKPEKDIVLPYALDLAERLRSAGHTVTLTRATDRFVALSERARIANEAGADLFVSFHANASDSPSARGAWTLYAAPSREGRRIAEIIHQAVHAVMGGNEDAVYPDASPWVGNRRLAVLRQTNMPAVLLELGFMTNPVDSKRMESPLVRTDVCRRLAAAIGQALGAQPVPDVAEPPLSAETIPPNLDRIIALTPEVMREVARVRRLDPERVMDYAAAIEAALRIMARSGVKYAKEAADLLAFGINMVER